MRNLVRALCLVAWGTFFVRVVWPAARTPATNGFVAIYTEAHVLLESPRDLPRVYEDEWFQGQIDRLFGGQVIDMIHAQPPPMSLIMAPVAWLAPPEARVAWTAITIVLWVAGLALLLDGLAGGGAPFPAIVWVGAVSTIYTPLADNLRQGQSYVLLFLLLCVAIRILLRPPRRRDGWAGVLLGLMLVLKGAGLWLWPLLAIARRGRVLAAGVATVVAVAALTAPLLGAESWLRYFADYRWLLADPSAHVTAYQTVVGLTGHLLVREPTWNPAPVADWPLVAALLNLAIIGAAFVESARVQRLGGEAIEERALSIALWVALMVPVAPRAEGYHYVLAAPALLIAIWWGARTRLPGRAWWVLAACALAICAPQSYYGSPRLERGWWALLAYPRLAGAFGLWGWLRWALRCGPRAMSDPRATSGPRAMSGA